VVTNALTRREWRRAKRSLKHRSFNSLSTPFFGFVRSELPNIFRIHFDDETFSLGSLFSLNHRLQFRTLSCAYECAPRPFACRISRAVPTRSLRFNDVQKKKKIYICCNCNKNKRLLCTNIKLLFFPYYYCYSLIFFFFRSPFHFQRYWVGHPRDSSIIVPPSPTVFLHSHQLLSIRMHRLCQ